MSVHTFDLQRIRAPSFSRVLPVEENSGHPYPLPPTASVEAVWNTG